MGKAVKRFTDLRAWQTCVTYKRAVYKLCSSGPLSRDWKRRIQLEKSVAGPPAHIAEGFGRFNPAEFARFSMIARSSLMESQGHLRDAVDKEYITEERRAELDALAEAALREVTGLIGYLESDEAQRNARRARERRIAARHQRKVQEVQEASGEPPIDGIEPMPEPRTGTRTQKSEP
jgi:four helix bundle protein